MWYIDGRKYRQDCYDTRVDQLLNNEAVLDLEMYAAGQYVVEGRVHGNPFVDTCSMTRAPDTASKRAENDAYESVTASEALAAQEYFEKVVPATRYVEGSFYIVDIDDPELVEGGEDYIHERLTSHLADPCGEPESTWKPWMHGTFAYMGHILVSDLQNGLIPGAIVVESFRQRLGLPYEWVGAPIK